MAISCHFHLSLCHTPFPFFLLDYAMNQPDVLSQIQPEGEHNTEDQAGPEESGIPTDPSEGKWEERFTTPVSLSWSETMAQDYESRPGGFQSLSVSVS